MSLSNTYKGKDNNTSVEPTLSGLIRSIEDRVGDIYCCIDRAKAVHDEIYELFEHNEPTQTDLLSFEHNYKHYTALAGVVNDYLYEMEKLVEQAKEYVSAAIELEHADRSRRG